MLRNAEHSIYFVPDCRPPVNFDDPLTDSVPTTSLGKNRALPSILSQQRPGRPSGRRFDFVERRREVRDFPFFSVIIWSFSDIAWH